MSQPAELYLDLMKRSLTNWIYGDSEVEFLVPKGSLRRGLIRLLLPRGARPARVKPFDPELRKEGRECYPPTAHTLIGLKRLDNLQACVEEALREGVPGDLIETGVCRGGAAIFMRAILKAHEVADRAVWCADSFAGLPPPDAVTYPQDAGDRHHLSWELTVPVEEVRRNFERYGLLDGQVRFLKGWFKDTLPAAPIRRLAVLRLDGDMYGSTMEALEHLYPKLSPGGWVIVDDYGTNPPCAQAVKDYRAKHGITEPVVPVDWAAACWKRAPKKPGEPGLFQV